MTTRTTYRVDLMLGRILSREIPASSEDAALEIAEYLYELFEDRYFESSAEDVMDHIVSLKATEAAK